MFVSPFPDYQHRNGTKMHGVGGRIIITLAAWREVVELPVEIDLTRRHKAILREQLTDLFSGILRAMGCPVIFGVRRFSRPGVPSAGFFLPNISHLYHFT